MWMWNLPVPFRRLPLSKLSILQGLALRHEPPSPRHLRLLSWMLKPGYLYQVWSKICRQHRFIFWYSVNHLHIKNTTQHNARAVSIAVVSWGIIMEKKCAHVQYRHCRYRPNCIFGLQLPESRDLWPVVMEG